MNDYHAILQVKMYRVTQLMLSREQAFFEGFGITQKQFNILRILRAGYPNSLSLKEVSERMIDRSSDITRLSKRLIKKHLIEVDTNKFDKRYKDAHLTQEGLSLLRQIDKIVFEKMQTGIQNLTKTECETLSVLLDKIIDDEKMDNTVIVK